MTQRLLFFLLPCLLVLQSPCQAKAASRPSYKVVYTGTFIPERGVMAARIRVSQSRHVLRELDLAAEKPKFGTFTGNGKIRRKGDRLLWSVPAKGGSLSWEVSVDSERGQVLDARMTEDWALVRLDDLFPSARVRSLKESVSESYLQLDGPAGWLFESRYGPASERVGVSTPGRRFDRPTGWLVAGKVGYRRAKIAERLITVAAPVGQGMHRQDLLAFMRWTLPDLVSVFPDFPDRLLIVGARDDMWRGGLSGPASIYLHSDRPLISENATSALLHELVHMVTGQIAARKEDWIIEGLAEYYSLETLRRSGGISPQRHDKTLRQLEAWAKRENGKLKSPSSGADTARAVLVLHQIQAELTRHKAGSLDAVIGELLEGEAIDGEHLLELTEAQLGEDSPALRKTLKTYLAPSG